MKAIEYFFETREPSAYDMTITEAEEFIARAKRVADNLGESHDEAPLGLGFISPDPPPPEAIELGRKLAQRFGW